MSSSDLAVGCLRWVPPLGAIAAAFFLIASVPMAMDYVEFSAMEGNPAGLSASMALIGLVLFLSAAVVSAGVAVATWFLHAKVVAADASEP